MKPKKSELRTEQPIESDVGTSTPDLVSQEIQLGKTILVIKAKDNILKGAETFLTKRDWDIDRTSDLRSAVEIVNRKNPQFVIIQIDHPNPKVRLLPKYLSQISNCIVVYFAEKNNSQSIEALQECGSENCVYPPVSGPAIERLLLKIQKKINQKHSDESAHARSNSENHSSENMIISIKGNISKLASETAEGTKSSFRESAPRVSDKDLFSDIVNEAPDFKDLSSTQGSAIPSQGPNPPLHAKGSSNPNSIEQPTQTDFEQKASNKVISLSPKIGHSDVLAPREDTDALNSDTTNAKTKAPLLNRANSHDPKPQNDSYVKKETKSFASQHMQDSIMVKGTKKALDEASTFSPLKNEEVVRKCSRVTCISINSVKFKGYLIAAFGNNRLPDAEFINQVTETLIKFVKSHGEDLSAEDLLNLELLEVPFEDWALKQADFLQRSVHEGQEIALAFFPLKAKDIKFEISTSEKMLSMKLDEIAGGETLEFDIYIYLATNQKYVRYSAQGNTFYEDQKLRLETKGITQIHLRKEDKPNVHKYRVRSFLNDQIRKFKEQELR